MNKFHGKTVFPVVSKTLIENILLSYASKPWSYWWKSEAEMKRELEQWHRAARARYQKFREMLP